MAASLLLAVDEGGNDLVLNSVTVGATAVNQGTSGATSCTIYCGTGAPSFTASNGSLYLRTDGSSTSTRLYVSEGSGTWTNFTSAA